MPRNRSPRARRSTDASPSEVFIPDKLYFRIGEVSKLTQTKPYVLRFWETEFPTLKPGKSKSGHRLYRREDVEAVLEIKRLLTGRALRSPGRESILRTTPEVRPSNVISSCPRLMGRSCMPFDTNFRPS